MPYSHRPYWIAACITLAACISPPTLADELSPATQRSVDYQSDIQPLLKKHCVNCHGSDKQESGLRLDARTPALQGGDSGKAITVGNSAESRLIRYVAGLDPDHLMPPEGPRLTADQIGLLRIWIDRGAEWPESTSTTANLSNHWAYQPIRRVTPPTVDLPAPPAGAPPRVPINPIDQFIIAKQIPLGLELSPEADRYTLIRRLSLDLLGLLPSVEQVDAFVNDTRPQAYELLVDQLLKSPHFGERWGRHWLDMARYADSDGYEKDNARPDAYRWRDWVIDAINADLPFDQFTIEQLAGDLLPNANDMQRLATAFHRQTLTNTEGGTDQEQFRVEACFDRTETTGAVWLGLTVGCARCHTHKYDAITQREYYQLFSFYNNGDEKTHVVPKSVTEIRDYEVAKLAYDQQLAMLESQLAEAQKELGPALVAWEADTHKLLAEQAAQPFARKTLESISANAEGDVTLAAQKDHSLLASGKNPDTSVYTIIAKTNVAFDTLRLDALSDKSLPAKGPGRVAHGNFVLSEITLESSASEDFASATPLPLESATSDHAQADKPWLAKNAIDGDSTTGWAIGPQYGQNHWAEFRLKEPQSAQSDKYLRIRLVQQYGKQHTLGRFKLSVQTGTEPAIVIPPNIVKILGIAPSERKEKQRDELLQHFSQQAPATRPLHEKIEELKKQAPAKPELTVRVLAQRTEKPRETFVLRRGEFLEPLTDAQVQPAGLNVLPQLTSRHGSQAQPDRLDMAQWLVSPQNPLTPRVAVNHVWRILFGSGIVKTANDFGVRGDAPTHPELLDWLAAQFMGSQFKGSQLTSSQLTGSDATEPASDKSAWSRKALIKLIVMSGTYRQSSQHTAQATNVDPQNNWLSRQNRLRVEGEIVRDISLDAAGLLSRKVGGPSVYPSLPPGIAELSYAGNFKWSTSAGEDQYRRGMYTFFKRTSPHPNLITFDCPDANLTCVSRSASNTPLQALVALNNATFAEAARALASRLLTSLDASDDTTRLTKAFRLCMARPPSDFERGQLVDLLSSSRAWYRDHPAEAQKLVDKFQVATVSPDENAAWIATSRILMNLDEFITRE